MKSTNEVKPLIITHLPDADGWLSGAIALMNLPEANIRLGNYGQKVPWHQLVPGQKIYILDFSYDLPDMIKLNETIDLYVIDHHITRIEEANEAGVKFKGVQSTERCAAYLTWEYFNPGTPIPRAVQLVDSLDRWTFELEDTLAFDLGLRATDMRPYKENLDKWIKIINDEDGAVDEVINRGNEILEYKELYGKVGCEDLCFEIELEGMNILVANLRGFNSLFFESMVDPEKHDAVMLFSYIGSVGMYRYSIYQVKEGIDVSKIAKAISPSGGGHEAASGATSIALAFDLPVSDETIFLPYTDMWKPVRDYLTEDKEWAKKACVQADRIAIKSQYFWSEFEGVDCMICNHPETHRRLFIPVIDTFYNPSCISFVWTKYGKYRVVVHNFNEKSLLDLKELAVKYDGQIVNNSLWFYVCELPFKLKKRK